MKYTTPQYTEWALSAGSLVSLPIAVFYKQFLIAATPLSFALCLNAFNRQQSEKLIQNALISHKSAVAELYKQSEDALKAQVSHLEAKSVEAQQATAHGFLEHKQRIDIWRLFSNGPKMPIRIFEGQLHNLQRARKLSHFSI